MRTSAAGAACRSVASAAASSSSAAGAAAADDDLVPAATWPAAPAAACRRSLPCRPARSARCSSAMVQRCAPAEWPTRDTRRGSPPAFGWPVVAGAGAQQQGHGAEVRSCDGLLETPCGGRPLKCMGHGLHGGPAAVNHQHWLPEHAGRVAMHIHAHTCTYMRGEGRRLLHDTTEAAHLTGLRCPAPRSAPC